MYTQQNLIDVQQAILDLATGKRTTSVTFNGMTVDYASADLGRLQALYKVIARSVSKKGRISTIVGSTGL